MTGEQLNAIRKKSGATMIEICCALGLTPTRWSKLIKDDVVPAQVEFCSRFIEPPQSNDVVQGFVQKMQNEYGFTYTAISEMLCLHASAASRIAGGSKSTLTTRQLAKKLDVAIKSKEDAEYWLATARIIKNEAESERKKH